MATVSICDVCGGQYDVGIQIHAGSLRIDPKTIECGTVENADLCSRECAHEWLKREQSGVRDTPVNSRQP